MKKYISFQMKFNNAELKLMKSIISLLFLTTISLSSFGQNFFSTKGKDIISPSGEAFEIRSINVTQPKDEEGNWKQYTVADAEMIKASGFNTVRIELDLTMVGVGQLEEFNLSQESMKWLNQSVSIFQKGGLRVIFALAERTSEAYLTPALSFWKDIRAQSKYAKIWEQIARTYARNSNVIGYDLFPNPDEKVQYGKYVFVVKNLIGTIQRIAPKHILFINGLDTYLKKWSDGEKLPFEGENLVFTSDFFGPKDYTLQKSDWLVTKSGEKYPDLKKVEYPSDLTFYKSSTGDSSKFTGSRDMLFYEGERFLVNDPKIVAAKPVMEASRIGKRGEVIFHGLIVTEYDDKGRSQGEVAVLDPAAIEDWEFESEDESAMFKRLPNFTHDQRTVLRIQGAENKALLSSDQLYFIPKQGRYYAVGGFIKPYMVDFDGTVRLTIQFEQSPLGLEAIPRNKKYLEKHLKPFQEFETQFNVPVFVRQVGLYDAAYKKSNGPDEYVGDLKSTMENYGLDFSYQSLDGTSFGLFERKKGAYEAAKGRDDVLEVLKK